MSLGKDNDVPESTTQTVVNSTQLPPETQQLINLAMPYITQGLQGYQPYAGNRVANLTPDQVAAQEALRMASGQVGQMNQGAQQAYQTGLSYLTNPFQNPAMQGAMDAAVRPIQQQFETSVLPNIRTSAVTAGQYGGSRQDLGNRLASQDYLRQVGDTSSKIAYDTFAHGLDTGIRSLALGPNVAGQMALPAQFQGAAGDIQQNQNQAEINANMQAYNERTLMPYSLALNTLNAAAGIPGGTTTSSNTADTGVRAPSTMQRVLGGAAQGAAIGGPWGAGIGAVLSLF